MRKLSSLVLQIFRRGGVEMSTRICLSEGLLARRRDGTLHHEVRHLARSFESVRSFRAGLCWLTVRRQSTVCSVHVSQFRSNNTAHFFTCPVLSQFEGVRVDFLVLTLLEGVRVDVLTVFIAGAAAEIVSYVFTRQCLCAPLAHFPSARQRWAASSSQHFLWGRPSDEAVLVWTSSVQPTRTRTLCSR